MRRFTVVPAVVCQCLAALVLACGGSSPSQPAPSAQRATGTANIALPYALPTDAAGQDAMKADVDAICNVAQRSGAADAPPGERGVHTAVWLGSNVTSVDGKAFLQVIQPLTGVAKADALDAMARGLGLASCPLSAEWRR